MPDIFDELVAQPPVPAGGGPTFPDVYPRAIAVNPLDEILAQITRAQPVNAPIATNGNGDGTPSSREGGDIFDQLAAENVPSLAPQTVEVPQDEQTAIQQAYGPGSFQSRAWSALKAGDPMLAQQIVGEATQRGIEGAVPDMGEPLVQSLKMDREDRSPAEVAKSIQANVDEPTRRAYKLATGQDMPPVNEGHATLATAAYNTLADTANFFNSPEGAAITAATGGAAALSPSIARLVTLGFSADAARSAIEAAIQGRTSDALESLGLAFGLGKAAHGEGAHTVGPEPGLVTPSEAKARGLEPMTLTPVDRGAPPTTGEIQNRLDALEQQLGPRAGRDLTPEEHGLLSQFDQALTRESGGGKPVPQPVEAAAPLGTVLSPAGTRLPKLVVPDVFDELVSETATPAQKPVEQMTPEERRADEKRIQKNLMLASLETDHLPTAFEQAGYTNVDGFWVHPHVDPEFVQQLSPETKANLKANGIVYFDSATEVPAQMSAMGTEGAPIRGIAVRTDREIGADAFTKKDAHVLHEVGHHIWQNDLTPEQRDAYIAGGLRTEHGQAIASGEGVGAYDIYKGREGIYQHGMAPEEDFAQHYAENGGDLDKTLGPPTEAPKAETPQPPSVPTPPAPVEIKPTLPVVPEPQSPAPTEATTTGTLRSRQIPGGWKYTKGGHTVETVELPTGEISARLYKGKTLKGSKTVGSDAEGAVWAREVLNNPELATHQAPVPTPSEVAPTAEPVPAKRVIPSLGDTGKEIYQGMIEAAQRPPPRARFVAQVVGGPAFDFRDGKPVVLEDRGRTFRDPTNAEVQELHDAIDKGTLQAEYRSTTGGTISNWTRAESPADYRLLHQATGKPLEEAVTPPPVEAGVSPATAPAQPPLTSAEQTEQMRKLGAAYDARKAAERLAKAPDTAPAKMKVQKAYLLDALNTAHKAAPEEAPTSPEHDAELRALDAAQSPHNYIPGYYEMSQPDKETAVAAAKAQQQELFGKYGVESEGDKADSNLREAVTNARGRALPKITIEVPGDGTFEIVNSKEAIAQFRDAARKRFPTTTLKPDVPTVGGRTTEAAIGAVSKKAPTREDLIKILGQAASTDETRDVLHNTVASTGNELVATDGRRLIKVDYEGPKINVEGKGKKKGESKPAIFDIKTLKRDTAKEKDSIYPNWKQVVPDSSKLGSHGKYTTADTGSLMKLITQAEQVMGEKTRSVKLWMDDKGKLGITASSPDVGEFAGGDADPNTSKVLGAYNPEFLKDGLRMARQLGHEKVDLYLDKKSTDLSPLSIQAKGMEYVLMPMRISDSGSLAPIGERAAGDHPMITDPSLLRAKTRADIFNELRGTGPGAAVNEMEARGIPTDAVQSHFDRVNAALESGQPQPSHSEFEKAIRSDLEKWNPDQPKPYSPTQPIQPAPKPEAPVKQWNVKFMRKGWEPPYPHGKSEQLVEAATREEAIDKLRREGVISTNPKYKATASPAPPAPIAEPGTELGLGGTRKPQRQTQPLTQTVAPNTTPQLAQTITAHTPGLGNTFAEIKNGLLQLVLPSARSPEHLRAAETLGAKLGQMHRRAEIASAALTPHERMFDRLGVDREGVAPADNVGTQFASAMSTGEPVPKGTSHAADMLKQQFDSRLKALRDAGAPLQSVRENYFPGMWTRESRLAFNAGLEEAMQAGVIPREGFNVNEATPDQRAWVKARVDEHLAKGEGSEKDMLPYLSRNPLRGKETFRKPKVFDDIMDAQEFGLRPASNNPIRLGKVKLAEMDRSIMAHQYFSDLKNKGLLQITSPYEKAPEGWTRINDPYGTIYGPPTVQLHEYVDQAVYQGLHDLAEKLGISHERGYGIGGTRLGYSVVGGDRIVTRYATETSVLAHELGHQLDERYGLWDRLEVPTKYGAGKTDVEKDLRAIADLTGRGKYARKKVEKMAQVIEAYVHAPEKMKEIAPTVFERFDNFVRSTPAIKELADIAPGIKLQKLTSEKYVGLPIMGYRVVPEAHGDILNNYLSSSLYNNKYLGPLYKAWMGGAGALNQAQLGVGSAFHVGFTSADVQVSAGAKMLKDIYGVLRGNRSIPDAIQSAAKTATAIVHTPILGDKVLNEWRNPQAPLDSKIVAVTRAAELAGGGFHMERGLRTEQADKVRSDWYSGHKLRAALRSPVAATELMAKPIMEYLVPRQKAGVFAELASRIIEQNPGKSLEELTPQFRQAWNRVDARLGQVMYDRLFINNVAKNVMQGTLRAPGWTGGTIAELGGAFPDTYRFFKEWAATGRPPAELPDRVAYTASLLMGTMIANGALTYAFTGQQPHGMDFFAFRDGGKDDNGNETRMVLPTYMKDILAYMRAPLHTLAAKTHPMINAIQELLNNKDYYGTEIRHPDDPLYKQGLQMGGYVAHQFVPFWLRGAQQQAQKSDIGVGRKYVAPYFGVMPAAKAITQSAAEGEAADISHAHSAVGGRTAEEAARSQARHQAIRDIAAHVTTATQERRAGHLLPGQEGEARHMARLTPLQRRIFGFGAEDSVRVWNKANETERGEIYRMVHQKIENSKILSRDRKRELLRMIGARPAAVPVQ